MRIIAEALRRFPVATDYSFLWPRLLVAAEPLMARLPAEANRFSGIKAPSHSVSSRNRQQHVLCRCCLPTLRPRPAAKDGSESTVLS